MATVHGATVLIKGSGCNGRVKIYVLETHVMVELEVTQVFPATLFS
jgi:hypothetical protein